MANRRTRLQPSPEPPGAPAPEEEITPDKLRGELLNRRGEILPEPAARPRRRKRREKADERGWGTAGDLDDVNANKKDPGKSAL